MDIGTGLFTAQRRPADDRSMAAVYDEVLDLAVAADDAGLDSVWVSEHHFQPDGYLSATMPTLGAIAAATDGVDLGTCIAPAPLYDAVRLAEDAATVDLLADGRLTLGLAIGSNPRELEQFGVDPDERVERMEDAMAVCRAAWSDGPLEYDAEFHPVDPDVTVTPKPDGHVPVMLGGAAKPAVRRAARRADGWCAPSSLSVEGVRKRVEDIRAVRDEEDLDGEFQVSVLQHGFVGDSRGGAWETMADGYLYLQRRYAEIFGGEPVDELDDDRVAELRERAVFGTPEQVVEELSAYRDALGDDVRFILRTYHPGVGTEAMRDCVERLGSAVAPQLR